MILILLPWNFLVIYLVSILFLIRLLEHKQGSFNCAILKKEKPVGLLNIFQ